MYHPITITEGVIRCLVQVAKVQHQEVQEETGGEANEELPKFRHLKASTHENASCPLVNLIMKAVPLKLITNHYDYGYFQGVDRITLVKRFQI